MEVKLIIAILLSAIISYLLGSCNSAIIVCKLWKKADIRTLGSKNAGLTNTLRVFGKGPALLTLIGDLAKGVIAVLISLLIFKMLKVGLPITTQWGETELYTKFIGYIAGLFAIIGHIFPIYYGFKGGKGVLVSCSILLVIDPITFCIVIPFFALIVILTRYVSVASILSAIIYPIVTFTTQSLREWPYVWLNTIFVVCTSILLIYMHRQNIKRLREGTENKFGSKNKIDNKKEG